MKIDRPTARTGTAPYGRQPPVRADASRSRVAAAGLRTKAGRRRSASRTDRTAQGPLDIEASARSPERKQAGGPETKRPLQHRAKSPPHRPAANANGITNR